MVQIAENESSTDLRLRKPGADAIRKISYFLSKTFPISSPLCSLTFRLAVEMVPSDITAMPRLHHTRSQLAFFCGVRKTKKPNG